MAASRARSFEPLYYLVFPQQILEVKRQLRHELQLLTRVGGACLLDGRGDCRVAGRALRQIWLSADRSALAWEDESLARHTLARGARTP